MARYTLKIYRREDPKSRPGKLIGEFDLDAVDPAGAIFHARANFADILSGADYAFIAGQHGRIVWEHDSKKDDEA
jgi:hypothetical protein